MFIYPLVSPQLSMLLVIAVIDVCLAIGFFSIVMLLYQKDTESLVYLLCHQRKDCLDLTTTATTSGDLFEYESAVI